MSDFLTSIPSGTSGAGGSAGGVAVNTSLQGGTSRSSTGGQSTGPFGTDSEVFGVNTNLITILAVALIGAVLIKKL